MILSLTVAFTSHCLHCTAVTLALSHASLAHRSFVDLTSRISGSQPPTAGTRPRSSHHSPLTLHIVGDPTVIEHSYEAVDRHRTLRRVTLYLIRPSARHHAARFSTPAKRSRSYRRQSTVSPKDCQATSCIPGEGYIYGFGSSRSFHVTLVNAEGASCCCSDIHICLAILRSRTVLALNRLLQTSLGSLAG